MDEVTPDPKLTEVLRKIRFSIADLTKDLSDDERRTIHGEMGLGQYTRSDLLAELATRYNSIVFGGIVWTAQEDGGTTFLNVGPSVLQAGLVHHLSMLTTAAATQGWNRNEP